MSLTVFAQIVASSIYVLVRWHREHSFGVHDARLHPGVDDAAPILPQGAF
jgi:hypothetical protein